MNTGKGWNMSEPRSINSEIREKRYEDGFRVMQGKREYVTYPDDSSLRIWYSDVPWRYENHEHSAVEICLTLEGVVDYMVQDTIMPTQMSSGRMSPADRMLPGVPRGTRKGISLAPV